MTDLSALLERVRAATGADQQLDDDIKWHFSEWENLGGWWRKHKATGVRERYIYNPAPSFTGSIDAALALVQAKLPDCQWWISRTHRDGKLVHTAFLEGRADRGDFNAEAPTAPLALCCALLVALIAEQTSDAL